MSKTKVSIITPFYNTDGKLFEACLDSIASQTYNEIEVILINDGSASYHECKKIAEAYLSKPQFKLINTENSGVSAARNVGIRQATGDYVLFVDSDDIIKDNYVEELVSLAQKTKANIIYSGKNCNGKIDLPIRNKLIDPKGDSSTIILIAYALSSQGVLIDAKIAKSHKFDTGKRYCEDTDYMLSILSDKDSTVYLYGEGGYYYVQNANSATNSASIDRVEEFSESRFLLVNKIREELDVKTYDYDIANLLTINSLLASLARCNLGRKKSIQIVKKHARRQNIRRIHVGHLMTHRKLLGVKTTIQLIALNNKCYTLIYYLKRGLKQ